jgi:hypothetical protein
MVCLTSALRVNGFHRNGKTESICYTFPVDASHDQLYVVLLRSEFDFERFRSMDIGALERCCGWKLAPLR